jgi:transposase-like protein
MKKYTRYSDGFKEQALSKVYSRGNEQSIRSVADGLNINLQTLNKWMKKSELDSTKTMLAKSKRPQDWRPEERLTALQETYCLIGEDLNIGCRERGVFVHQLEKWKADFCSPVALADNREEARTLRTLKAENQRLELEVLRKDRALAEAVALLVLQKKFRALPSTGLRTGLGGEAE